MLEKIDLSKKMSKNECKDLMERLTPQLSLLQREMRKRGVPVMIVFEGFGSSGKGTMINELIQPMDPRGFKVFTIQRPTREEAMHPYLWRFWTKLPENGRIHIFDRSWYTKIVEDRAEGRRNREKTENCYNNILDFEKELTQSGMLIIKFFLHISRKEQKKRFKVLESAEETRWRVTEDDWKHNRDYDEWLKAFEETGLDIAFYNERERGQEELFPWDFIDIGVTKAFLRREWDRAMKAEVTPNCRQKCSGCGVGVFGGGVCIEGKN